MSRPSQLARRYLVRGRVQGVGFRAFVLRHATELGVNGYVRNVDTGDVEVYASGSSAQLNELAGYLWQGPHASDVRAVDEHEAEPAAAHGFTIRH